MSTAALCKGKQSRSVLNVYSGHLRVIPPVSGPASSSSHGLLLLCMGSVTPVHSAICSDSIDAEIRGVGQEDTGTHMFGGRSGDASPESLSPQASLLDQTVEGRWKVVSRVAAQTEKPTTSWFPCCFPTAPTNVINNAPPPPYSEHSSLLPLPSLHSLPLFLHLHLLCCTYTWVSRLLNQDLL